MAGLQLKSEMQSRSRDTRATRAEECRTARAVRFICKRIPAVPLSVKPFSQHSLRNVRGSVTLSPPCQGSACCLCVPQTKPSFEEEEEGRK